MNDCVRWRRHPAGPRHGRAGVERLRLHGDSELAGLGIARDDRVGHTCILLVHAHRDRADVTGAALLDREHAALAAVDEDRVLAFRMSRLGARQYGAAL